jgi:hypothetical protein
VAETEKSTQDIAQEVTPDELLIDEGGSSWRALLIAIAVTAIMNAVVPLTHYRLHTISLLEGMIPLSIFLPFIVLAFIVNPLIRVITGKYLRGWELVLIFSVGYVSSTIGELIIRWIATISVPYYLASPENRWAQHIFPYLKDWLVVKTKPEYLRWFWEGLPKGASFPWQEWVVPLFWWLSFFVAIGLICMSLATILRRQWVENERLPFPLAQVPLELARDTTRPSGAPGYMKGKLFWIGFIIPFFILCWEVMTYFYPGLPSLKFGVTYAPNPKITFARDFPAFYGRVNFFIIAFGYFTSLKILFSIWLFNLLAIFQVGYSNRLGIPVSASHQANGALILFVIWGLWMARRQIGRAFGKAFGLRDDVDDSRELFSYRTAVFGLIIGLLFVFFWLRRAGANSWVAFFWMFFLFLLYIGIAKVAAASGLVFLSCAGWVPGLVQSITPHAIMGKSSIVTNTMLQLTWQSGKGWIMPQAAASARLIHLLKKRARTVGFVAAVSFILAILASTLSLVYLGHRMGAINFGGWDFEKAGPAYMNRIRGQMKDLDAGRGGINKYNLYYLAIGMAASSLLIFMNYRFTWWPLHPIGLAVGWGYSVRTAAFSIFIVWLCKLIILRVGGMSLYNRIKPFFLGMIVGYAMGLIVVLFTDMIFFPGKGHNLYWGD